MYTNYGQWSKTDVAYPKTKKTEIGEKWINNELEGKKLPNSKSADVKYRSLKVYVKDILKSSLITSVPEIAATKSIFKKIIKIFVFVICLIGFIYQTLDFLWLYLSYPTVVNVLISNPFEIEQPSITVCNRNRQRRSVLCSWEDNECSFMPKERYCELYPRNCPNPETVFTGNPFINQLVEYTYDWQDEAIEAHNESMIHHCQKFIEGNQYPCELPYRQVPAVTPQGEPNYCYTIESLWGKPDHEPEIYPNTFTIQLDIITEPHEYIIYTEPILMQVAVHDRRRLVNPYTEGYSLKGGVEYEATVTMTEKKLLPKPYDTNCTDYLKIWERNNGTGPLTDLMCIEYCKLQTLLSKGKCIDKNVAYPHTEKLCPRGIISTTSEIIEACTKHCGPSCRDRTYEVRYEEVNNFGHMCQDDHCKVSRISLTLYFNQFRVTKFQYQPKFELADLFHYIQCYLGMWLALSMIPYTFDTVLNSLIDIHKYFKLRKKKSKATLYMVHVDSNMVTELPRASL